IGRDATKRLDSLFSFRGLHTARRDRAAHMESKVGSLSGSKLAVLVQCRNLAEEYRGLAGDTSEPATREILLRVADSYELLAVRPYTRGAAHGPRGRCKTSCPPPPPLITPAPSLFRGCGGRRPGAVGCPAPPYLQSGAQEEWGLKATLRRIVCGVNGPIRRTC